MKKKICAVFMAMALALSLVACGTASAQSTEANNEKTSSADSNMKLKVIATPAPASCSQVAVAEELGYFKEEGVEVWSCNGTPVDCVKMALAELCPRKPDMVIGGINHGDNGSVNTHYSGTMGVTMEGCMKYIPSVAFSLCDHRADADFRPLEPLVRQITQRVLSEGLPQGVCLNVNFPLVSEYKGVRVCRMAKGTWANEVSKCHHPRGYDYWWMVGHYRNDEPEAEDTDNWALNHGYVAITPTRVDVTAYKAMETIKSWNL